jgi:hypothetical protein
LTPPRWPLQSLGAGWAAGSPALCRGVLCGRELLATRLGLEAKGGNLILVLRLDVAVRGPLDSGRPVALRLLLDRLWHRPTRPGI